MEIVVVKHAPECENLDHFVPTILKLAKNKKLHHSEIRIPSFVTVERLSNFGD